MMCITDNVGEPLTAPVAPGKRKRLSKKNKKAWRKHTKINDVEKFLQDKLREERTGGDPTLKKNKELFYIDKSDLFQTTKTKLENMKCHSELQSDTRTAAVMARPTAPKKSKKSKVHKAVKAERVNVTETPVTGKYDIWSAPLPSKELDPSLPPPKKQPSRYVTCDTLVPAVVPAHPGSSYNPDFKQHQDLLGKANAVETERMKEQERIRKMKPIIIAAPEEEYLAEMSQGLNTKEDEEEIKEEPIEEEMPTEDTVLKTTSYINRKTKQQRSKEKLEKKKRAALLAAKHEKKMNHDLLRIKSLTKQLKNEGAAQQVVTEKLQVKKKGLETRPGKFGPGKFTEVLPEFSLPEEISSSLRKLDPQGSLLTDRFQNMQKRNMIEVRKKVMPHRKYKLKQVEKWSKKLPEELHELVTAAYKQGKTPKTKLNSAKPYKLRERKVKPPAKLPKE